MLYFIALPYSAGIMLDASTSLFCSKVLPAEFGLAYCYVSDNLWIAWNENVLSQKLFPKVFRSCLTI